MGLLLALLLAGAAHANPRAGGAPQRNNMPLSPVIISSGPMSWQASGVDAAQVKQMVNRALMTFTSAPDIATAWQRLSITPQDVVGIKITTAGGPGLCTHPAIVRAICDGLVAAGVPKTQIIIWDKFRTRCGPAGYAPHAATDGQPAVASVRAGKL